MSQPISTSPSSASKPLQQQSSNEYDRRSDNRPYTGEDGAIESAYASDSDNETSVLTRVYSRDSDVALVGSYRRPSFTFGQSRPTFTPTSPIPTSINTLNTSERTDMIVNECELLRDNKVPISRNYGTSSEGESLLPESYPSRSLGTPSIPDETTALVASSAQWEEAVKSGTIHTTYTREAKVLLKYSFPLYITFLLQYSLTLASIFAAGNIGKNELAGVSLGSMTAVITGYAPYQGLSTALDTLCAQAYGSGNKTLVGLQLQRMVWFLMLVSIPIIVLWQFSEGILNAIVLEPELAAFAGLYLRILSLGAPGFAIFEASKRFVQAQGLFTASTYVLLFCAPINALLNYFLVWHPTIGIGYAGAPVAVVITNWLMPLFLFLYVKFVQGMECWGGFSKRGFTNWWPMIKLAVPGFIMLEAEYLAFEILTLVAARFGTAHVAAQSILTTISTITFQLPFSVAIATSTRVANFLGATLGEAARTTTQLGLMVAGCVGIFNTIVVIALRHKFAGFFSDDPEVIALFVKSIPIGCAFQFFDAIGVTTAGILRGQGKQHLGGYINLVSYYALGLPISLVAAFVFHLELVGLWTGVALSLFWISILEVVIIYRSDWDKVVNDAKERVHDD
ncbi:mate-domain-containing protein [Geopyxis carbonaria]|nr:mate-domain-containing protein [Geopyxis carbonaria]